VRAAAWLTIPLLAAALAGCSSPPKPGTPLNALKIETFRDDFDCDGRIDEVISLGGLDAATNQPAALDGQVSATLRQVLPAGLGQPVDNWTFAADDPNYAVAGKVEWLVNGNEMQSDQRYNLTATVTTAGGRTLSASAEWTYGFAVLAEVAVARAC
jgi:hypothetical protein